MHAPVISIVLLFRWAVGVYIVVAVFSRRTVAGGRGKPKTRLRDSIKDICGLTMVQVERKVQARAEWRRMVERLTATQS